MIVRQAQFDYAPTLNIEKPAKIEVSLRTLGEIE